MDYYRVFTLKCQQPNKCFIKSCDIGSAVISNLPEAITNRVIYIVNPCYLQSYLSVIVFHHWSGMLGIPPELHNIQYIMVTSQRF